MYRACTFIIPEEGWKGSSFLQLHDLIFLFFTNGLSSATISILEWALGMPVIVIVSFPVLSLVCAFHLSGSHDFVKIAHRIMRPCIPLFSHFLSLFPLFYTTHPRQFPTACRICTWTEEWVRSQSIYTQYGQTWWRQRNNTVQENTSV